MTLRDDLHSAADRIRPYIHRTPLLRSRSLSVVTGAEVHIKAENLQKTGSYKVRGVFNKVIGLGVDRVVTASMGNHAQALAYAARQLAIRARIVMPLTVSILKEEATRGYGAEVVLHGENLTEALACAHAQEGYSFIHPFDDDEVILGQSTVGLEIIEELSGADAILVPVGGGGLIAGTSLAVKEFSPRTEIIGVQTESAPGAYRSFSAGRMTAVPPRPTLADGIAVEKIGQRSFAVITRLVDDMVLVKEETIALAILLFLERMKLVVEGAGAAALAALLSSGERFRGKHVVLVVSGGNIDPALMDRILRKGLVTSGRIATFEVIVDDAPGSLHALTGIIARRRVNILEVSHNRLAHDLPLGKTRVMFTVEVRTQESLRDVIAEIREGDFTVCPVGDFGESPPESSSAGPAEEGSCLPEAKMNSSFENPSHE
jgi:threonine dehydratase